MFLAFHVPIILAVHLSLGAHYKPEYNYRIIVFYPEFHRIRILLFGDTRCHKTTILFQEPLLLDLYIREFVSL